MEINKTQKISFEAVVYVPYYAPWDWNIYLHLAKIYGFHVGKYSIHGASECYCQYVSFCLQLLQKLSETPEP